MVAIPKKAGLVEHAHPCSSERWNGVRDALRHKVFHGCRC